MDMVYGERLKIVFMRTKKIDELKCESELEVDGSRCSIEWMQDKIFCMEAMCGGSVPESLLTPPEQESPQHILNALNDDCLRSIFESNNMEWEDLCSIGSVCSRFNEIVRPVYRRVLY